MSLFGGLLLASCLALSKALRIPINGIAPSANVTQVTSTPENWSPSCVNANQYTEWAGTVDFTDCASALLGLKRKVAVLADTQREFYSRELIPGPVIGGWGLPSGSANGSCAVFARMAIDFDDHTLPLMVPGPLGPYFPTGLSSPTEVNTWDTITAVMADMVGFCVSRYHKPAWAIRRSDIVVVVAPLDSPFRRRWWASELDLNDTHPGSLSEQ